MLDWLARLGVGIDAVAMPVPVRVGRVCVNREGRYTPNVIGDFALILPVLDSGGVLDFCAWVLRTGEIGTRLGIGAMLGGELVGRDTGDGVTVPPLQVFQNPVAWLRARRQGIVVLNWQRAALALSAENLVAESAAHAAELRKRLRVPGPVITFPHRTAPWLASRDSTCVTEGANK